MSTLHRSSTSTRPRERFARAVTEALAPQYIVMGLLLLVGAITSGWSGVGWAVWAILFAAVLPLALVKVGIRRGRWADRHLSKRAQRMRVMPVVVALVAIGLASMLVLGAPHDMVLLVVVMVVTLLALTAVTTVWKISVHTTVMTGAVTQTAYALGPWWAFAAVLVPLVAWSRVVLRAHTFAQTVVGAAVGFVLAAGCWILG
ncbi:phosphatase PAP2 family protein [Streptomyces sp. SID3343]|uniref:phosphatase PAP2 family protein n=1 Tax=Streptomyces sp. SID3343 TaxID=2690260 RepID=UPI00136DD5C2|nr:phosphatase PAP2 family protein [Streptomyces sp. SID3343]MYW03335.1 hypothetical protein [Streptomyces sp. SID3343]MYW06259.1 hypothetical protein [Streptomyces sp. SID3343]